MSALPAGAEWRPIEPGSAYYVSDDGRCYSMKVRRELARTVNAHGGYIYVNVKIAGRQRHALLSRLVCEAFHGAPPADDSEVRHLNGVRTDNRASNLAWGSREQNTADRLRHGTYQFGEQNPSSKLTDAQVVEIRRLRAQGLTLKAIGRRFGVTEATVCNIAKRNTHRFATQTRGSSHVERL